MYAMGRLGSYISRGVYTVSGPFHPFGGAVDIIVVEQPDGSFKSSPWYIKFGKFQGVLKTREKVVNITVNGVESDFHMYLNHKGEAYFLREVDEEEVESIILPSSSSDETDVQSQINIKPTESKSLSTDVTDTNEVDQIDARSENYLASANSHPPGIMERESSLQRAEIAADLLEVEWATNLATKKPGNDKPSRSSAYHLLDGISHKDLQIHEEQTQAYSILLNDNGDSLNQWALHEETAFDNVQMHNNCNSGSENAECSVEEISFEMSSISAPVLIETSTYEGRVLREKCESISEISRTSAENFDHDECVSNVIFDASGTSLKLPRTVVINACADSGNQFGEQVSNERNVVLQSCYISEEVGTAGIQSLDYYDTSDSLLEGLDGCGEQAHEMSHLADRAQGEAHGGTQIMCAKDEVLHPGRSAVQLAEDSELKEELMEAPEYLSQEPNPSHSCIPSGNKVEFAKPHTVPERSDQRVRVDCKLCLDQEDDSLGMYTSCSSSRSNLKVDENITSGRQFSLESFHNSLEACNESELRKPSRSPFSGTSEEEHILFSGLNESKIGEVQNAKSASLGYLEEESHSSYILNDIKEVSSSADTCYQSNSTSDIFVQEYQSNDSQNLIGKTRVISRPTSILRNKKTSGDEIEQIVESMPGVWSHIECLDIHDLHHPLSHSLNSDLKPPEWTLPVIGNSSCGNSNSDEYDQLEQEQSNIHDMLVFEEIKKALVNPAVEISLCKHLLCEAMGDDAISQTFEAEKLDLDKFTSLDPAILKNDRIVARIGDLYLPWDEAKPIVLGMVSSGNDVTYEPKEIIDVERVEMDPSEVIVPSNGSWRRWPFSLQRSRSRKATQPTKDDATRSHTEDASKSNIGTIEDGKVVVSKRVKKIFRAITPTSQQLASLNLVEGRNMLTLTFSTAVLGKQQVDARIYLWKWNTRVVISDVDGTITKSDVLGQVMHLVGRDWSQTGVAHLFSAIKDNGYQLLFLSARAISQAYHTRQFLFNLKQDGKGLPDGPTVISPDGLFPSLFREVIRRAPHEFKITCLEDIRALFPSDCNPFYAGFGNRDTDEITYLKVGIPKGKIFTINPKGEIAVNRRLDTKSYTSLHTLVNAMFPSMASSEKEDFNSWNYWKLPPLVVDI